jgi:hypothetical protein
MPSDNQTQLTNLHAVAAFAEYKEAELVFTSFLSAGRHESWIEASIVLFQAS